MDQHTALLVDMMAGMLSSGEQTDLIFRCSDGIDIKGHRLVASLRSTVISAACNGPFKEAQSGVIELHDFDSATVCRMLAYMYTGDYEDGALIEPGPDGAIVKRSETAAVDNSTKYDDRAGSERHSVEVGGDSPLDDSYALAASDTDGNAEAQIIVARRVIRENFNMSQDNLSRVTVGAAEASDSDVVKASSPALVRDDDVDDDDDEAVADAAAPWPPFQTEDAAAAAMVANAHVFTIADYYAMPSLKERAVEKLLARAHNKNGGGERWPTDALAYMLHIVTRRVRPGDTLYDVVYAAAMERAAPLVAHRRFRRIMRAGGAFAADFAARLAAHATLERAAQRQRAEARLADAHKEVVVIKSELPALRKRVAELEERLHRQDALLDKHAECRHCDADFSCFFDPDENCLRCSKCRTRHF